MKGFWIQKSCDNDENALSGYAGALTSLPMFSFEGPQARLGSTIAAWAVGC